MSYEIRTPLNGIIGMTDILNRYEQTAEIKEVVSLLRRSTEVLLGIINDILDFSKIESGKMLLDEAPFNIREEISYGIGLSRAHLGNRDVNLTYTVDDNVPESVIGDSFRLRQVLVNLVNHAIFNTDKGEILVKTRVKESKNGVILLQTEVADTGKGFDKATLKKIFGDFVDTDTLAARSNDESAFGTIIAKQLVELMGGDLAAISPSGLSGGTGTKVVFTIRVFSNEKQIKDLDLSTITNASHIRTLVITGHHNRDDEFMAIIHKLGLQASVTSFHKATINQIKANLATSGKYNLIVITDDLDFDGFEAARAISEHKLNQHFRVFMVSSNDRKGNYLKSINLGVDNYIVKPFDQSEFYSILKENFTYLESEASQSDADNIRSNLSILIVEDNKMNQIILVKMLKNIGYDCDVAEDGYEGFLCTEKRKYDMIFMDLLMPEMDGFESARRIIAKDKQALIVAFTADNMPETRRKAELSGIRDFIAKPVRLEDLRKLFAKHFNK
jgi:CheY-like chemotaxis protein